jgi:hypothetical protein
MSPGYATNKTRAATPTPKLHCRGAFSLTGGSNKNRNFSIFALIQFDELNPCDIAQIPSETSIPAESIDGEAR